MPLVLMCGFPSSGKSHKAQALGDYLSQDCNIRVNVIGDNIQGIDKNCIYADSKKEKELRANLKSAVQRALNKEDVVILDSLNYIKGFRYELFCVCKSARTTLCVIHCDVAEDVCRDMNVKRSDDDKYTNDVLDGLFMRFEPPNSQNRWDSPLFVTRPDESLNCKEVYDALFLQRAPPPNQSTQSQPLAATNYLQELDRITQNVVAHIISTQKTSVIGDLIVVPGAEEKLMLSKTLSLGELQRCKRQFITFTKSQVISDVSKIGNMFVVFLNKSLS